MSNSKNITNFKKVCEFNKCFGLPHFDTIQNNILSENQKLADLRINLIVEEVNELNDAFKEKNFIEVIDALSDILYVLYGAGSSFGVNLDDKYIDKLKNTYNITNINPYLSNYFLLKKEMEKQILIDHVPFIINKDIFNCVVPQKITLLLDLINADTKSLVDFKNNKDLENVIDYIVKLLISTYKIGIFLGILLDTSYKIVHDSNMSKLCKSKEESIETVEWYKINETRYDSPNYRKSDNGDYWVVYNESSGKILKSINYTKTNFEVLLKNKY